MGAARGLQTTGAGWRKGWSCCASVDKSRSKSRYMRQWEIRSPRNRNSGDLPFAHNFCRHQAGRRSLTHLIRFLDAPRSLLLDLSFRTRTRSASRLARRILNPHLQANPSHDLERGCAPFVPSFRSASISRGVQQHCALRLSLPDLILGLVASAYIRTGRVRN